MRRIMKNILLLSIFLVLVITITSCASNNIVDFNTTSTINSTTKKNEIENDLSNFNYTVDNDEITIIGVKDKTVKNLTVPMTVSKISEGAFSGCSSLESITLPFVGDKRHISTDTYQYPFGYIFGTTRYTGGKLTQQYYYGSSATSTTSTTYYIPETLKEVIITDCEYIQYDVFSCCSSLTSITLPSSVTSIGDYAFWGCSSLTSIEIPTSVTSIGDRAFSYCSNLTSIEIPASVTSIGNSAFSSCIKLVEVINKSSLNIIKGSEGYGYIGYYAKQVITDESESKLTTDANGFVTYNDGTDIWLVNYIGNNTEIVIPNNVTKINDYAFENCSSLTSIEIPTSVTSIGDSAFWGCSSLTSIEIPASVTSIGNSAFYNCRFLTSIEIPNGVKSIGYSAFQNCSSLTSITLPSSVTSIGDYAFYDCSNLTSIEIPTSVTSIGDSAFSYCSNLTSIEIPASVTSIGDKAFSSCIKLVEVINKSSLNIIKGSEGYGYIGYYAKQVITDESKSKITIDENGFVTYNDGIDIWLVNYVGSNTEIVIPNNITKINDYAFYNCRFLTSIEIPASVTSIGYCAFWGCSSLTSIEIPASVTSIGEGAFSYCSSLTSVTIGNGVTSIGEGAFSSCSSLTSITLPSSVTSIGYCAFSGCSFLTSIEIPASVTSIGNSAFSGCSSLTSITLPSSVTSIGDGAFYRCYKLVEVINKSSLNITKGSVDYGKIGLYAKQVITDESESKITTDESGFVTYNDGTDICLVNYIGSNTEIVIPNNVTKINDYAFFDCRFLTSIEIPTSVTSIGDRAFNYCSSLTNVYYDGTIQQFEQVIIGANNYNLTKDTIYYYSETAPTTSENYWHYNSNNEIEIWN